MVLPDKVIGWFYLRRAGLKQDQRQMVMSTLSVEKISLETVRKALNFVIGPDNTPIGETSAGGTRRSRSTTRMSGPSLPAEDAAAEYDEVYAAYVEARSKVNQMRLARGFYPVVAMIDGQQKEHSYKGNSKSKKGKSKKGKGSKQAPRPPPQTRARGKAALGGVKCFRCGATGHYMQETVRRQ